MAHGIKRLVLLGAHGIGLGLGAFVWLIGFNALWDFVVHGLALGDLWVALAGLIGAGLLYRAFQAAGWLMADRLP